MLIKITAVLIVITLALRTMLRVYGKTLSATEMLRIKKRNYKKGEKCFFFLYGWSVIITFIVVVVTAISMILKYL